MCIACHHTITTAQCDSDGASSWLPVYSLEKVKEQSMKNFIYYLVLWSMEVMCTPNAIVSIVIVRKWTNDDEEKLAKKCQITDS